MATITLIPDTNVFIQCKNLNELPWADEFDDFEAVVLVVTRPLQKEIDKQKSRGNDRVGRRARKTASVFKDMIVTNSEHVIREEHPRVVVAMRADIKPEDGRRPEFEMNERDDQVVACGCVLASQDADRDVRLLTHDSGPMATAQLVGLPIYPVPDHWLAPPEPSPSEKKVRVLEAEVKRLKHDEPVVTIHCLDAQGNQVNELALEQRVYQPLDSAVVETLMSTIAARYPIASDFGSREPRQRVLRHGALALPGFYDDFIPAKDEEIETYRHETYPNWLETCRTYLATLHTTMNSLTHAPLLHFALSNTGIRPAKSVLVEFIAQGGIEIMPPPYRDDEDPEPEPIALPPVPAVPSGRWVSSQTRSMAGIQRLFEMHQAATDLKSIRSPMISALDLQRPRREDDKFYYKSNRPQSPGATFSLECNNWRHDGEQEPFLGEVHLPGETLSGEGAITCRVQAENLSTPMTLTIPTTLKVRQLSLDEEAQALVEGLQ